MNGKAERNRHRPAAAQQKTQAAAADAAGQNRGLPEELPKETPERGRGKGTCDGLNGRERLEKHSFRQGSTAGVRAKFPVAAEFAQTIIGQVGDDEAEAAEDGRDVLPTMPDQVMAQRSEQQQGGPT